jgi:hypothetical protein
MLGCGAKEGRKEGRKEKERKKPLKVVAFGIFCFPKTGLREGFVYDVNFINDT